MQTVPLYDIEAARQRIAARIVATPMAFSVSLSERFGVPVHLKLEQRQTTGSFKLRGASNAVASLNAADKARGVVAASTGNHGRALAHAARLEGVRAVICMSKLVPTNKVEEIRRLGAEIRIVGNSQDEAQIEAERLVADEGLLMVPPFDDPAVIAGQGTLGLEIVEAVPDVATILVQLSGGGLASGVAAAVKGLKSSAKVIGISMERGAAMKASLDAGHPVQVEEMPTLADSLGGGIGLHNRLTFAMCRDLLDDVVLLSEEEIAAGIVHAYRQESEIVEGAGAIGIDMGLHRDIVCGSAKKERAA
jgi:threonine dehydratase